MERYALIRRAGALILAVILASAAALVLASCEQAEYVPDYYTVAVDSVFTGKVTPFYSESEGDLVALSLVTERIMEKDGSGKWVGNIGEITYETVDRDGSEHLLATVRLNKNIRFSDGNRLSIDDVLFMYYIFADPCYTGIYSDWHNHPIVGVDAYYYDDPEWTGELEDFGALANEKYSPSVISESDLYFYFVQSNIGGQWNSDVDAPRLDGRTWRQFLIDEGMEDTVIKTTDPKLFLDMIARIYSTKYSDQFDYTAWWAQRLEYEYLRLRLDTIDVAEISGIKRVDDLTCTVEFFENDADVIEALNVPVCEESNYASMGKGNGDYVASSGRKSAAVGMGAYVLEEWTGGIITLKANKYYYKGKPQVGAVDIRTVDESLIYENAELHQIALGFVSGEAGEISSKAAAHSLSCLPAEGGAILFDPDYLDFSSAEQGMPYALYVRFISSIETK